MNFHRIISLSFSIFRYSTLDYYYNHMLQLGYGQNPLHENYLMNWIVTDIIFWCTIFFFCIMGLNKCRGFMTTITKISLITLMPVVTYTLIVGPNYSSVVDLQSDYMNLLDFRVQFIFMLLHNRKLTCENCSLIILIRKVFLAFSVN